MSSIVNRKTKEGGKDRYSCKEVGSEAKSQGSSHFDGFHIFLMLEMRSNTKSKGRVIDPEF